MSASSARSYLAVAAVLTVAVRAHAVGGLGDIVFDPTIHAWHGAHEVKELAHWAEELKSYADFANKQLDTIEKLSSFKDSFTERVGDWKGVYDRAVTLRNRAENLKATIGQNFNVAGVVDYGAPALLYSDKGNYTPIDTHTIYGTSFTVPDDRLKRYNSVFALHKDVEDSGAKINAEIAEVLTEIADTSKDIIASTDQEKLAKLQEKKATLLVRLGELQRQLELKMEMIQMQTALNENREKLEREVRREKMNASFKEARARDRQYVEK